MNFRFVALAVFVATLTFSSCAEANTENDKNCFFTKNLPQPDHAEVILIQSSNRKISLSTKDAQTLAALIRSQSLGPFGKKCFNPQYTFNFYDGEKLIASESICFGCEWIAPLASDVHPLTKMGAFDSQSPEAKKLQNYLANLFSSTQ
jgi:hypothetical protein